MSSLLRGVIYGFVATKHTLSTVSLPVFLVYIATLWRFRRRAPYNSGFFAVALHCAVVDVIALLHQYILVILPRHGLFTSFYLDSTDVNSCSSLLATYGINSVLYLINAQTFGIIVMSANRFTAVIAPTRHQRWWSAVRMQCYVVFIWLGPALLMLPSVVTGIRCWSVPPDRMFLNDSLNGSFVWRIRFAFNEPQVQVILFVFMMVKLLIAGTAISVFYLITFIKLWRQERKLREPSIGNSRSRKISRRKKAEAAWEVRVTIVAAANFATVIICVLLSARGNYTAIKGWQSPAAVLEEWLSDCVPCASTFVSPYMLLLLSAQFRRHFVNTLCFWRPSNRSPTNSSTLGNRLTSTARAQDYNYEATSFRMVVVRSTALDKLDETSKLIERISDRNDNDTFKVVTEAQCDEQTSQISCDNNSGSKDNDEMETDVIL